MRRMQATFESTRKEGSEEYEFEQEALAKRHSMTHEAVQTGKQAGAYRTILTHFSQRYPKIPVVDDSFLDSTCIAFDLMSVNLKGAPHQIGLTLTHTVLSNRVLISQHPWRYAAYVEHIAIYTRGKEYMSPTESTLHHLADFDVD